MLPVITFSAPVTSTAYSVSTVILFSLIVTLAPAEVTFPLMVFSVMFEFLPFAAILTVVKLLFTIFDGLFTANGPSTVFPSNSGTAPLIVTSLNVLSYTLLPALIVVLPIPTTVLFLAIVFAPSETITLSYIILSSNIPLGPEDTDPPS